MKLVSTKEIMERFELSYQTVNYYTNLGFFNIKQKRGNRRLYDEAEVGRRIKEIFDLKNQGYPLRLIVRILSGGRGGKATGR